MHHEQEAWVSPSSSCRAFPEWKPGSVRNLTSRGCEPVREGPRAVWEGGVRRENETERTGQARTSMGSSSPAAGNGGRRDFRAST